MSDPSVAPVALRLTALSAQYLADSLQTALTVGDVAVRDEERMRCVLGYMRDEIARAKRRDVIDSRLGSSR